MKDLTLSMYCQITTYFEFLIAIYNYLEYTICVIKVYPVYDVRMVEQMNITDVRIRKISGDGKMRAVASITLDDEFVVHDIKIIDGQNGLFIAMPSKKMSDGDFRDVAHPIRSEVRAQIRDTLFEAYENMVSEE